MSCKFFKNLIVFLSIGLILIPTGDVRAQYTSSEKDEKKIVYLTFDDGPGGDATIKVLDVLKAEEVPATFFIIGNQISGQEDIILRMKNEGHSIGLHSFTHDRNKLYNCNEGFISEMKQCQEALFNITGDTYTILRFPFGTNNSTYKLTKSMVATVHKNCFKIYDWTQDTLDGANPNSCPETIMQRAISTNNTVIILMHTSNINMNSAKALPGVIHYYKAQGYEFKKITPDTPEVYKITRPNC